MQKSAWKKTYIKSIRDIEKKRSASTEAARRRYEKAGIGLIRSFFFNEDDEFVYQYDYVSCAGSRITQRVVRNFSENSCGKKDYYMVLADDSVRYQGYDGVMATNTVCLLLEGDSVVCHGKNLLMEGLAKMLVKSGCDYGRALSFVSHVKVTETFETDRVRRCVCAFRGVTFVADVDKASGNCVVFYRGRRYS